MSKVEDPLLSVRNLTTRLQFGKNSFTVVKNLSFDLNKGETVAIVGESGCGKSMTALSILRILPEPAALASEGQILFHGKDLLSLSEKEMQKIRGHKIALIFQDPRNSFNPVYTIGSQLLEVLNTHFGEEGKKAEERVIEVLEEVRLPHPQQRMKEYPHQMSGGMLQRAMIAMALLGRPELLIADEPTTALDVSIQVQILSLLMELKEKKGMGILLITHDMGVVAELADRVVVMYATEKIEEAPVVDLFDNPSHPYTQALFNARLDRPLKEGRLPQIKGQVPPLTEMPPGCHFHPRCRYALPLCKTNAPPAFSLSKSSHTASCWLFDEEIEANMSEEENGRE